MYTVTHLVLVDLGVWLLATICRAPFWAWILLLGHSLCTLLTFLEVVEVMSTLVELSLDRLSSRILANVFFREQA